MKYDAVRRPPVGAPKIIERGLSLEKANRMVIAGQCDQIEPAGFRDSLDAYAGRFVLLEGKRPIQADWPNRSLSVREVEAHVRAGGNIGIRAGAGLAILDFDDPAAEAEMLSALGPLTPTVETGSGKRHYYVGNADDLPAKIRWKGKVVGDLQRTPAQQVVCPPSIHPDSKREYRWLSDPRGGAIQTLPARWRTHLLEAQTVPAGSLPEWIKKGDERGHEADGNDWNGPDVDEILARASRLPGARRRAGGVKFQCAGCRAEGRDRHMDNAQVREDGRWGCAVDSKHKRAIGEDLGIGTRMGEPHPAPMGTDHDIKDAEPELEYPDADPPDYPDWEDK